MWYLRRLIGVGPPECIPVVLETFIHLRAIIVANRMLLGCFILGLECCGSFAYAQATANASEDIYIKHCASCHGRDLKGGNAQSMVDGVWQFGAGRGELFRSIKFGISSRGMPDYQHALNDDQINGLMDYILDAQNRLGVERPPLPERLETRHYDVGVSKWVTEGLEIPWALVFIDERTALVTERPGRLRMVVEGRLASAPVRDTPPTLHEGQGGYMDVAMDPNYHENGWIYLSYSDALQNDRGEIVSMTRIVRGRIRDNSWSDSQDVFKAPEKAYSQTRHHYGSRLAFDHQGHLLFSVGERGDQDLAQDPFQPQGKIHRVQPNGAIPDDNPYASGESGMKSVYSYGHRNPQGLAVHPETGEIWETEHGPMGGDEVNLILAGGNYGWPVSTYGINYDGASITDNLSLPKTKQPALYWVPSIAVCGTRYCVGPEFPLWRNDLLVGGATRTKNSGDLVVAEGRMIHQEVILKSAGRVRDVACDPAGAVYIVLNRPDMIIKLTNQGRAFRQ